MLGAYLSYGQVCWNQVFLLVDRWNVGLISSLANDLTTPRATRARENGVQSGVVCMVM